MSNEFPIPMPARVRWRELRMRLMMPILSALALIMVVALWPRHENPAVAARGVEMPQEQFVLDPSLRPAGKKGKAHKSWMANQRNDVAPARKTYPTTAVISTNSLLGAGGY